MIIYNPKYADKPDWHTCGCWPVATISIQCHSWCWAEMSQGWTVSDGQKRICGRSFRHAHFPSVCINMQYLPAANSHFCWRHFGVTRAKTYLTVTYYVKESWLRRHVVPVASSMTTRLWTIDVCMFWADDSLWLITSYLTVTCHSRRDVGVTQGGLLIRCTRRHGSQTTEAIHRNIVVCISPTRHAVWLLPATSRADVMASRLYIRQDMRHSQMWRREYYDDVVELSESWRWRDVTKSWLYASSVTGDVTLRPWRRWWRHAEAVTTLMTLLSIDAVSA